MDMIVAGALTLALIALTAAIHGPRYTGSKSHIQTTGIYDAAVYGKFSQVEGLLKQSLMRQNACREQGLLVRPSGV